VQTVLFALDFVDLFPQHCPFMELNLMDLTTIAKKPNSAEKSNRQNSKFKHLMLLHWMMASLLMLLYLTGVYVAHPPQANFVKWLSPFLHQSVGKLFLVLLVARIFVLLRVVRSKYSRRLPNVTPNWLKTVSFHTILYFFMLIAPISGFLLRNFRGVNTTFFGISVPPIFAANSDWIVLARSFHFWASYIFLAFIGLHILVHWKFVRSRLRSFLPISHKTRLQSKIADATLIPTPTSVADTNLNYECNTSDPPTSGIPVDRGD